MVYGFEKSSAEESDKLNFNIPRDISIVGHNYYDITNFAYPSLSTIEVPIDELGRMSAEYILKLIAKEDIPTKTILPTNLIWRDSVYDFTVQ